MDPAGKVQKNLFYMFKAALLVFFIVFSNGVLSGAGIPSRSDMAYFSNAYRDYSGKKYRDALKNISQAIAINQTNAAFYLLRGNIYFLTYDKSNAEKDYRRSLELNPQNAELQRFYNGNFKGGNTSVSISRQGNGYNPDQKRSQSIKRNDYWFFNADGAYELDSRGEGIIAYQYGSQYLHNDMIFSVNVIRELASDVRHPYDMTHVHFGGGIDTGLGGQVVFFQLIGGIGFSSFQYKIFIPDYVLNYAMANPLGILSSNFILNGVLQGWNVFIRTGLRIAFNQTFGLNIMVEGKYISLSYDPVFNALFSGTPSLNVLSFNAHVGVYINALKLF